MSIQRGVEHTKGPIVKNATHTVECSCGFKSDVVARDTGDATSQFIGRHIHPGATFIAQAIEKT
jgi:hypothetical protein